MMARSLTFDDLDAVSELDRICFTPETAFSRDVFESCLEAVSCESFGFDESGELIAFAVLHFPGPRTAQIFTLDVHPGHRRRGLANRLMAEIEARARRRGVRRVALQVATSNEPAIALYQKWGFSIRTVLPDYYGRGKDAFLMDRIFMDRIFMDLSPGPDLNGLGD